MNQTSAPGVYRRLLSYVLPHWPAFLLSTFGFLIYSLSNVAFLNLVGYIVDSIESGGSRVVMDPKLAAFFSDIFGQSGDLNRILVPLAVVLIAVTRGAGTFIGNYFIAWISNFLVHKLRCELFDRLLTLPSAFYDRQAMGHLVAKVTFHVNQVTGAATDAVRIIIREGFTVAGYLAFLLYLNWKLTLIFLAVAPLITLLVNYAGKRFRRISEHIQNSMGDVTHVASEAIQGHREVRTFGGSDYEAERFDMVSQDNRRQSMKMVVTASLATPAVQIMVAAALAGLVWLILDPVFLANMSAGDVIMFITTGGLLAKPIRLLSEVVATVQKGLAAAEDIFSIFDQESEPDRGELEMDRVDGHVEFRQVAFGYPEDNRKVLDKLNFTVEPGQTVALVGRSGSGKSTIVNLIPRFYTPDEGKILIDGHPIQDFKLTNLRQHIAIVSQQVTLFNDTVLRNIGYGALQDASREAVREAAEKAYAWPFIEALESGLDTIVGDDGVLLSGGQRQRLAIARAFLKDAPILILDEATSALDTESERYIQAALEAVVKGRTTFIIAHRLSTIEKADRILVIDEGQIVEEGTHQELLARQGFYAQLHAQDKIADDEIKPIPRPQGGRYPGHRHAGTTGASLKILDAWYGKAAWLKLLTPLAYIYRQMGRLRKRWHEQRARWQPPVPVIVVGNIAVGGTGKSPLVIALAQHLLAAGHRPGIVSRGYGGRSRHHPLEVTPGSDVQETGDEPLMIYRRTDVPVVIDPDRVAAAKHLLSRHDCDVVLSDDGLQHYALSRDIEIAVVDGALGLGNGKCLPAGPLREPPSRLDSVDLVVVNGTAKLPVKYRTRPSINMQMKAVRLINLETDEVRSPESLVGENLHAVAGISNPERFFATLTDLGCMIVPHQFPDHHDYIATDVTFNDHWPVVMTEKDAVKIGNLLLPGGYFWYLEVDACLDLSAFDTLFQETCLLQQGG